MLKKWLLRTTLGAVGLLALAQLVPYGRDHARPPIDGEPAWPSASARALAVRACFDCHSNETQWPWYSHVAPVSWLVQRDIEEGRRKLNFSEWNRPQEDADEMAQVVRDGEMPPAIYTPLHPQARLSTQEREELAQALDGLAASATSDK